MAFIQPEIVALARIKIFIDIDKTLRAVYEFSNGFDAVEVPGALPGSPPIFIDDRTGDNEYVVFLSVPVEVGSPPSQAGIKANFSNVAVSSTSDPYPVQTLLSGDILWQYGDYSLAGTVFPALPRTPYAKVDPQKALRFKFDFPSIPESGRTVDVSVFKNPMTLYR